MLWIAGLNGGHLARAVLQWMCPVCSGSAGLQGVCENSF